MNGGTANYPATGTAAPSNYPPSSQKATTTGTASGYPPTQNGYGATNNYHGHSHHHHGSHVNEKAGFVNGSGNGYGNGNGYVQQAPVAYGPDGRPIVKKNHRLRNAIVGVLAVCCCCIAL
jgi:hypothetical protein